MVVCTPIIRALISVSVVDAIPLSQTFINSVWLLISELRVSPRTVHRMGQKA